MSIPQPSFSCGRRTGFNDATLAEIKRLYVVDKLGMDQIGKRFNCAGGTIRYWLDKMGVQPREKRNPGKRGVFKLPQPTTKSRARAARNGALSIATMQAKQFRQPSLIDFSPNLRLQTMWVETMQAIHAERGMQWQTISWAHQ